MNDSSERVSPGEWVRSQRFEIRGVLGMGASSVVLSAYDHERREEVALKVARENSSYATRALHQEFDITRSLSHPGFVAPLELFQDAVHPFFSMERIEGTDLVSHVCEAGAFDEARLRKAFAELVRTLRVLHRKGRVHRDVKPSNVRVTAQGRVVLLDLGLCIHSDGRQDSMASGPVGTAYYMAPEQATGDVSPASDLYSVGVLLSRCLTGSCPFEGPDEQVMLRKQTEDSPPLAETTRKIPVDLARVCMQLLSRDPALRPSSARVLLALEPARERRSSASSASLRLGAVPIVGREAILSQILDLGAPRHPEGARIWISGDPGLGKTAVLGIAAQRLAQRDPERTWVLRDRAEPHPWLPYQGISRALSALALRLRQEDQDWVKALAPLDVHCMLEAFPVFKRVAAFALLEEGLRIPDPVERRWRAFHALRALLGALAHERHVVFALDDLHWADGDTLQLLQALIDSSRAGFARPAVLWLISAATSPPRGLANETTTIALSPLSPEDVLELSDALIDTDAIEEILPAAGFEGPRSEPRLVVETLRQVVFFGREAIQFRSSLHELYARRISSLDERGRRALEACAIAGRPLPLSEIAVVSDFDGRELAGVLGTLRALGLLQDCDLASEPSAEVANLTIRTTVIADMGPERVRELNLRLVAASQSTEPEPTATLLRYQLGSAHLEAARRTAMSAARSAEEAMAFEHAAHLYELSSAAWDGKPDDTQREVLRLLGEALACAGHAGRAAVSFTRAAAGAKSADSLEMRRRAAEYWLRSGHIAEGIASLVGLLSDVSVTLPRRGQRALASMVWQRAALTLRGLDFERKNPRQLAARDLTRVDVLASVGSLIGLVDFVSGADFQTRAVREALSIGEPQRIAKALCVEATFASATEPAPRSRAKRLVEIASGIAEELDSPYLRGMALLSQASIQFGQSDFDASARSCMEGEKLFREACTGVTWELGQIQHMTLMALMQRGALRELTVRAQRYQREALERGDLYGWTHLVISGGFMTPLIAGDLDEAKALVLRAMARWPRESFHIPHFFELMALVQIDLGHGGARALERLDAIWPALKRSMLLRVPIISVSVHWMRALSLLSAYLEAPAKQPQALRAVRDIASKIRKVDTPHYTVFVGLLTAQVALLEGDRERALVLAQAARAEVTRFGFGLFAERIDYFCGTLTKGEAGERLRSRALAALKVQGVTDPVRYVLQGVPILEAP